MAASIFAVLYYMGLRMADSESITITLSPMSNQSPTIRFNCSA
jgi:hypothetical protein